MERARSKYGVVFLTEGAEIALDPTPLESCAFPLIRIIDAGLFVDAPESGNSARAVRALGLIRLKLALKHQQPGVCMTNLIRPTCGG